MAGFQEQKNGVIYPGKSSPDRISKPPRRVSPPPPNDIPFFKDRFDRLEYSTLPWDSGAGASKVEPPKTSPSIFQCTLLHDCAHPRIIRLAESFKLALRGDTHTPSDIISLDDLDPNMMPHARQYKSCFVELFAPSNESSRPS